jgi:hypothetical protein
MWIAEFRFMCQSHNQVVWEGILKWFKYTQIIMYLAYVLECVITKPLSQLIFELKTNILVVVSLWQFTKHTTNNIV